MVGFPKPAMTFGVEGESRQLVLSVLDTIDSLANAMRDFASELKRHNDSTTKQVTVVNNLAHWWETPPAGAPPEAYLVCVNCQKPKFSHWIGGQCIEPHEYGFKHLDTKFLPAAADVTQPLPVVHPDVRDMC